MFIAYVGKYETIVTTTKQEKDMLELFFVHHTKRKLMDYTRIAHENPGVWIQAGRMRVK